MSAIAVAAPTGPSSALGSGQRARRSTSRPDADGEQRHDERGPEVGEDRRHGEGRERSSLDDRALGRPWAPLPFKTRRRAQLPACAAPFEASSDHAAAVAMTKHLAIVPAYNEAAAIGGTVARPPRARPGLRRARRRRRLDRRHRGRRARRGRDGHPAARSTSASAARCRRATSTRSSTATTSPSRSTATASTTRATCTSCSPTCAPTPSSTWSRARASSRPTATATAPRRRAALGIRIFARAAVA